MRTIYLYHDGQGWLSHSYNDLKDLKALLEERIIKIGDRATIGYRATIGEGATIGDRATIGNDAIIGEGATIGDDAIIGDGATIGDGVIAKTMYITDVRHPVSYWGEDCIQIGCKKETIQKWADNFRTIGVDEDYSSEEIERYGKIIQLIKQFHEFNSQKN